MISSFCQSFLALWFQLLCHEKLPQLYKWRPQGCTLQNWWGQKSKNGFSETSRKKIVSQHLLKDDFTEAGVRSNKNTALEITRGISQCQCCQAYTDIKAHCSLPQWRTTVLLHYNFTATLRTAGIERNANWKCLANLSLETKALESLLCRTRLHVHFVVMSKSFQKPKIFFWEFSDIKKKPLN